MHFLSPNSSVFIRSSHCPGQPRLAESILGLQSIPWDSQNKCFGGQRWRKTQNHKQKKQMRFLCLNSTNMAAVTSRANAVYIPLYPFTSQNFSQVKLGAPLPAQARYPDWSAFECKLIFFFRKGNWVVGGGLGKPGQLGIIWIVPESGSDYFIFFVHFIYTTQSLKLQCPYNQAWE